MVKRIFTLLNREIEGIHEAAYLLAGFALLSHLLAIVRDRLLAHSFGASELLDIYYAAFRIPDFIFVSLASIVSLFVLIPYLEEKRAKNVGANSFISSIFSAFFIFIVLASAAAYFLVPSLSQFLFPGFSGESLNELILLTRIMLLSPILLGISNIYASVTQLSRRFFVYALSPVLYNIGIIIGVFLLYPIFGISGLAIGVVLGALLHMLIQVPVVLRSKLAPRLTARINFKEVWRVVRSSIPRTTTLALNQVVLIYLLALASKMTVGSISIFTFGNNIQGVPLSIIGVSYSVAAFPTLTSLFYRGELKQFSDHMIVAIRHILFWATPAAVLFIVLRAQIVRVALGSGQFDWSDTRLTAAVVALFAVSLVAQSLELLFIRGYYAAGRTLKPFIVKLLTSAAVIFLAFRGVALYKNSIEFRYFVESLLRIEGIEGSEVVMLALAFTLGILISTVLFWLVFRRDFGHSLPPSLYRTLFQSFSGGMVAGAASYGTLLLLGFVLDLNTFVGIFLQGLGGGVVGVIVGAVTLKLLGNREVDEVIESLRHKFWQSKVIIADPEEL